MKFLKLVFASLLIIASFTNSNAQSNKAERGIKTDWVFVDGTCEMDKHRIENSALSVKGVSYAFWNEDARTLMVKYQNYPSNLLDIIEKKIADNGNDTEKYRTSDSTYNKIATCCHYRDKERKL